jgi:hypothetical protein
MTTTVEISEDLFNRAAKVAAREGKTVQLLVEEVLQQALNERRKPQPFRLRDGSFGGGGLRDGIDLASWATIRDMIYEGRGSR